MRPAICAMLGAAPCFVASADSFRIMARLGGFCDNGGRRDIIGLVPAGRVVLEHLDHRGQRIFETMPRLPAEQLAGARDRKSNTSELQSLMRTSYAVFCLKKKNK